MPHGTRTRQKGDSTHRGLTQRGGPHRGEPHTTREQCTQGERPTQETHREQASLCFLRRLRVLTARCDVPGARRVLPGLYDCSPEAAAKMVAIGAAGAECFEIYAAACQWSPQQLSEELSQVKRSTGHTHTPTENNTPDTHTHTHDKNNTPNPQTNTLHKHLTTLEGGATTVRATQVIYLCLYLLFRVGPSTRRCAVLVTDCHPLHV